MTNQQNASSNTGQPWIVIHDQVWTSEALMAEVEKRAAARRAELGPVNLVFPTFGHISTYPEPPATGGNFNPNLYYYLKQANQARSPSVEPILSPSPATRVPVLGRLWRLIRSEMHNLILFYVNRTVSEQNRLNIDLISTLNELTRENQAQKTRIDELQAELQRLHE
ncbi:MAG: hypothetical protein R6X18_07835 [Chloroflexota bacterium]|jgi:hypothetical protein